MKSHTRALIVLGLATSLIGTACSSQAEPQSVTLLTHESFALSDDVLAAFTEDTGITITVEAAGDAGTMVNQAILTKDNPIADVLYGIDNTFLSRAQDEGIFAAYTAADIATVDPSLRIEGDAVTPIDFGDVCINWDEEGLATAGLSPPSTLDDLIDPAYAGTLVVEDPGTSSPGLAFLLATVATYPEEADYTWVDYWTDLFANDVAVASDWSDAYYTDFTRAGGDRPLVVSYASSPPAEVFFGELDEAPTGVMTASCFRQVEYAGVLAGTEKEDAARQVVDFLLSRTTQEDIPLNMFVYPANREATLPEVFATFSTLPNDPATLEPAEIDANRERWIATWTDIARS